MEYTENVLKREEIFWFSSILKRPGEIEWNNRVFFFFFFLNKRIPYKSDEVLPSEEKI